MTVLEVVSKIRKYERVSLKVGDEILFDCVVVNRLCESTYFKNELANKEATSLYVGAFCELVITIAE